jgi:endonuclease/exonuclease/phosphatase family metal-dependent hydrolase
MRRQLTLALLLTMALGVSLPLERLASAQEISVAALDVMTLNVWHGLRSGESRKKFPGEDPDRAEKRFEWQIEEIKRLDPDVLLFQEVNPNQPQSHRYAQALGYDEIHKVTSCGLHLGGVYKIPKNVNDGLAILAKPALRLRRAGTKRLSGNAMCSATWGFQTKESRYALFGEVTVAGQKVLLATTHLASPSFTPDDFDDRLEKMVESGELTAEQRDEILTARDKKLDRNTLEAQRLLEEIDKRRTRLAGTGAQAPVIFGGDFNAEADRPGIAKIGQAGFTEAASGPAFLTWNPVVNEENYTTGTRRHYSLPTFDNPEIEAMLDQRHDTPRQIDHLFVSTGIEVSSAEMVMTEAKDGIYPSDHFGILATLRLP